MTTEKKVKTEIRREETFLGTRWIVYADGKRRANTSSKARAEEFIRELKAKGARNV